MGNITSKWMNFLHRLKSIALTDEERTYIRHVLKLSSIEKKKTKNIILVQMVKTHFFWARILPAARSILQELGGRVVMVDFDHQFRYHDGIKGMIYNFIEKIKWLNKYKILRPIGILNFNLKPANRFAKQAKSIISSFKSKHDIINFRYEETTFGDLIYDTYLRFKGKPTVDLNDPFLVDVFAHFLAVYDKAKRFFLKKKVAYVLTSYSSYTHHGVLVRIALKNNVRVFSVGCIDPFMKEITLDLPCHVKDYTRYVELLKGFTLEETLQNRDISRKVLESRFNGKIDASISYMKQSSFSSQSDLSGVFEKIKNSNLRKVLIPLHCFFDSPHGYRNMIYPDFYVWIDDLLSQLTESSELMVLVKSHPNGLPGNDEIVSALKQKYPQAIFLEPSVSNLTILNLGLFCVFTVHGTIGHEFPYFDIPVVNAGDNPHTDFRFCVTPKTLSEYKDIIKKIKDGTFEHEIHKDEILDFYFMHAIHTYKGRGTFEVRSQYLSKLNDVWNFDKTGFSNLVKHEDAAKIISEMLKLAGEVL